MRQPATAKTQGLARRSGLDGQGGVPQGQFELGMAGVGEHQAQDHLFGVGGQDVQRLARLVPANAGDHMAVDDDLAALDLADGPLVVVVGSEDKGLSRLVSETCDQIVSIPISSATESLNAGIAASVALYQVASIRAASE